MERRFRFSIVFPALVALILLCAGHRPANADTWGDGGVPPDQGVAALYEGLYRAAQVLFRNSESIRPSLTGPPAQQKEVIRGVLEKNPQFLSFVTTYVRYLIYTAGYKGENLLKMLRSGQLWSSKGAISAKGGAVTAEALLAVIAVAIVAGTSGTAAHDMATNYLAELETLGDAAEREAYNALVRLLLDKVASGQTQLCNNMTFAEAVTRLRINMHTSPTRPFWQIICAEPPARDLSRCFSRDGRHDLCRRNNCSIPERREMVCLSRDGRNGQCQKNGCNPVFTNRDGTTYRIPCYWEERVTPAVPCYWD